MLITRKSYLERLDNVAESAAKLSTDGTEISALVLKTIVELYKAAKAESSFTNDKFETAYHSPITGELEFLVARILYHYSSVNGRGWKILLRRQVNKTAPDIRIEVQGKTIAVIEVKAKAGWIQPFFSAERYALDEAKFAEGGDLNPELLVQGVRRQLDKYRVAFGLSENDVFMLLPTLALVHRKKSETDLGGYLTNFESNSGLPAANLILLSGNINLDLSYKIGELEPTDGFERLLQGLDARTPEILKVLEDVEAEELVETERGNKFENQKDGRRLRANSREFMRRNFPELKEYLTRTSRRYDSHERNVYGDDWWFTFSLAKLKEKEQLILVCAEDDNNKDFKVLKVPYEYFEANIGSFDISDTGLVTLYVKFDTLKDGRHSASMPFEQFALN